MWTPCAVLLVVTGILPAGTARKDFSPRLGYNTTRTSGRLDVYLAGKWTPVCDNITIDDNLAKVVCRELGLPSTNALAFPGNSLFTWDNITDRENLQFKCHGTEKRLAECKRLKSHVCEGPVAIVCSNVRKYQVRLVGGDRKVGRLEVRIGNVWGTVCNEGFSNHDARAVCIALGYLSPLRIVWPNEGFGRADPNTIMWPYQFSCRGWEMSLERCRRRRLTSVHCPDDKGVAVSCKTLNEIPLSMRLVGGASNNTGRLEVSLNGQWGTVCSNYFSSRSARVACRQMGLPYSQAEVLSTSVWPSATGPIFLDGVRCYGFERHILYCFHNAIGVTNNCNHDMDVAIECKGEAQTTEISYITAGDVVGICLVSLIIVVTWVTIVICKRKRAKQESSTRRESIVRRETDSLGLQSRLTGPNNSPYNSGVFYTNNSSSILAANRRSATPWPRPPSAPSTAASRASFIVDPPSYAELFSKEDGQTPPSSEPPPSYHQVTSSCH